MRSPQLPQDVETRDDLAHGLLQSEGGTSAPEEALADLRLRNVAAAIASGDLLQHWQLGVDAVARCLRRDED